MKDIALTADRIEIIELINQFGMLIDLRDWENFANLFSDSVEFDYSSIGEVAGSLEPKDIVNNARKDLGGFQATQHMITNH
ncbi:MAG: nuclear transport factor 2 family protein, partial [Cyanobacteria bacterium J06628_3]